MHPPPQSPVFVAWLRFVQPPSTPRYKPVGPAAGARNCARTGATEQTAMPATAAIAANFPPCAKTVLPLGVLSTHRFTGSTG